MYDNLEDSFRLRVELSVHPEIVAEYSEFLELELVEERADNDSLPRQLTQPRVEWVRLEPEVRRNEGEVWLEIRIETTVVFGLCSDGDVEVDDDNT